LKKAIFEKREHIKSLTVKYNSLDSKPTDIIYIIDLDKFKKILFTFNKITQDAIIAGKRLNFKNGLGYLEGIVVPRNHKRKMIDQNETKIRKAKLLAEGVSEDDLFHTTKNPTGTIKYTVFRTDDDWCRIKWDKAGVKNSSVYEFKPTDNRKDLTGFKNRFSRANLDNPLLKLRYKRVSYSN
jgi:hypothetical protein